jgi:hypothetical protein
MRSIFVTKIVAGLPGINALAAFFDRFIRLTSLFDTASARVDSGWLNKTGVGEFGFGSSCAKSGSESRKSANPALRSRKLKRDLLLTISIPPSRLCVKIEIAFE